MHTPDIVSTVKIVDTSTITKVSFPFVFCFQGWCLTVHNMRSIISTNFFLSVLYNTVNYKQYCVADL